MSCTDIFLKPLRVDNIISKDQSATCILLLQGRFPLPPVLCSYLQMTSSDNNDLKC